MNVIPTIIQRSNQTRHSIMKPSNSGEGKGPGNGAKQEYEYVTVNQPPSYTGAVIGVSPYVDGSCHWGAIDIDYPCQYLKHMISFYDVPFMTDTSKSGGLHLFFLFHESQAALHARNLLHKYAVDLGLGKNYELFPSSTTSAGKLITLPQSLDSKVIPPKYKLPYSDLEGLEKEKFWVGPDEGERNTFLYNFGRYLSSNNGDVTELKAINSFFVKPLQIKEVESILQSITKNNPKYSKTLDLQVMRHRKTPEGVTIQFEIETPLGTVILKDGYSFNAYANFAAACREQLTWDPPEINGEKWIKLRHQLFENCDVVVDNSDITEFGHILYTISDLLNASLITRREDIPNGGVFFFEDHYIVKATVLRSKLRERFRRVDKRDLTKILGRGNGYMIQEKSFRISEKKVVRVLSFPEAFVTTYSDSEPLELEGNFGIDD